MARPRKGAPKVGGSADAIKKGAERKGNPDVKFLQDLERYDRTEVHGKDPDKHYRWCRARDIGLRKRQGYEVADDPTLIVTAPGGSTTWAAEGSQAGKSGTELVLMEMPKKRFGLRQDYKQAKRDEQSRLMDEKLRDDSAKSVDSSMGQMLPDDDNFIGDLRRSG